MLAAAAFMRRLGGRLAQRIDDAVDDLLDQHLIVALAHHADHRFGAGRADHQAAIAVEPLLARS